MEPHLGRGVLLIKEHSVPGLPAIASSETATVPSVEAAAVADELTSACEAELRYNNFCFVVCYTFVQRKVTLL
jgi:hypothetical protein